MNAILSNPFKAGLSRGETQIGLWLSSTSSYVAEIAATAGYDWLLIDGEHAPNDLRSTMGALQAVASHPSHPIVRLVEGSTALIKQMLDIGAKTLLVPMVDTAEQARGIVAATQYPPLGIRGVGSAVGRSSLWSSRSDYLSIADDEVCLVAKFQQARQVNRAMRAIGVHLNNSFVAAL